eukprot:4361009-Prorocentrum_lima.AAC.1
MWTRFTCRPSACHGEIHGTSHRGGARSKRSGNRPRRHPEVSTFQSLSIPSKATLVGVESASVLSQVDIL